MTPPETTEGHPGSMVGAAVTPFQADADAAIRLAVGAEELGYARFGAAEGWTYDAVALLAQIAGVTSRIGLATGVLPVWSRTPAAIAMAAASLQRASAGRFALGLGASSPPLVEGLHGIAWERPISRMRTTLVAVRALLDGARVPLDRDDVRALRLGAPPESRVPIYLAALAPSSVRLAGSSQTTGCRSCGPARDSPTVEPCSPRAKRLRRTRRRPGSASASRSRSAKTRRPPGKSPPVGCSPMSRGWAPCIRECSGISSDSPARSMRCSAPTRAAGRRELPAAAERLAREVAVMGTYDEAPDVVRRWLDEGADAIDLVLPLGLPEEQLHEMLRAAAPATASSDRVDAPS